MSATNLPPTLAIAYAALSNDPQAQHWTTLQRELEAISDLVARARKQGVPVPDWLQESQARAGITVGSDKICPCCLRPFDAKEP
jgi:hypothetical protein